MKPSYVMWVTVLLGGIVLMPQAVAENPLGMTLSRELPETYTAGGTVEVELTLSCTGVDTILALGAYETVPADWTFVSMREVNGAKPQIGPQVGDSGTLEFAWFSIPALPCTFAYTLNVPADAQGLKTFTGQIEYRLGGGQLFSDDETSTIVDVVTEGEGAIEGQAEGEGEGIVEGQAEGEGEGIVEGQGEGEGEGIVEGQAEGEGEGMTEGEAVDTLAAAETLQNGFSQADQNADGSLSFAEASTFAAGLTEAQFNELDTNGDGSVTAVELAAYIEANTLVCGCNCNKAEMYSGDWFKRSLGDLFLAGLGLVILVASARMGRYGR
ncbi:MAG TPA: hypothetical protein PLI09_12580 [Candidatus Hydrogenedentes bacterium]|nr:hypothetical protein [Candidatus Hydrogenedentota bacterium]